MVTYRGNTIIQCLACGGGSAEVEGLCPSGGEAEDGEKAEEYCFFHYLYDYLLLFYVRRGGKVHFSSI